MFKTLFLKECRQILHSLVYYLYLLIFIAFMVDQLGDTIILRQPQPDDRDFGMKVTANKDIIIRNAVETLAGEIEQNSFTTYPIGYYKEVVLSNADLNKMKEIKKTCESKNISYSEFQKQMENACEIVGPGSMYKPRFYKSDAEEPKTYDDAIAEFHAIGEKDGVTGAFMRYFCDYGGIMLALLPIFLGVTRCVRDKRAKASQVIYSKVASSGTILFSRYFANAFMIFIPVVILACALQTTYIFQAKTLGITPHYLAFLGYSCVWLLPTILFVLAMAFLLTELFNGIVAMLIQVFVAFLSLMSMTAIVGSFGLNLIPRWNSFGDTLAFMEQKKDLFFNRGCYILAALVFMSLATLLYEYKRKGGRLFYGKKAQA